MKKSIALPIIAGMILVFALLAYADGRSRRWKQIKFSEDFNPPWYLVVFNSESFSENDPPPILDHDMGLPPPSLDVNGNGWCGNGAYSKETFDYTKGLVIEWDMFVGPSYGGWNWGRGGLSYNLPNLSSPRDDGAFVDDERCDSQFLAWVEFIDPNFDPWIPYITVGIVTEDGSWERFTVVSDAANLLDDWHHFTINIRPHGHVDFYLDNMHMYKTSEKIDPTRGALPVLFGDRDFPGPVRIDNVKVHRRLGRHRRPRYDDNEQYDD